MTVPAVRSSTLCLCPDCDRPVRVPSLKAGMSATCPRCDAFLYRRRADSIERTLSYAAAALILFVVANSFPFMTFSMEGRRQESVLISGVLSLFNQDMLFLSALVLFTMIVAPFLKIAGLLYVLVPLHAGRRPLGGAWVFRAVERLQPWAMTEVYLLGVFVAYVKLRDLATLELGVALFSFAALMVLLIASDAALEPKDVWDRLAPDPSPPPDKARSQTLASCHACQAVVPVDGAHRHQVCPRCGANVHRRKPESVARTWALILTAAILYIPANIYPVMTVISFGRGEPDTILSGVVTLFQAGMWPLALLVFFASITVPMLKLFSLAFLLISVQMRWRWRRRERTRLYRIVEGVGRWSMIDVFMISILVALVKLGSIATIEPGIGANAFAAVVVVTMIAAETFDPRLIWDAAGSTDD
jgi:paraquat-inducible protein A